MKIISVKKRLFRSVLLTLLLLVVAQNMIAREIRGRVSCDGRGLKGVVVTDGIRCVDTNERGEYRLMIAPESRFVYLTLPSGYLIPRDQSRPLFYQLIGAGDRYSFELQKNPRQERSHLFVVHADPQLFELNNMTPYGSLLEDCKNLLDSTDDRDCFMLECGDMVGDKPDLFEPYIQAQDRLCIPVFRAIGNHDMTLYGRSNEGSTRRFEDLFGPAYYSFNRGKVHYVVLNDVFYLGRDYFYMGYLEEKQLAWLEQDLRRVEPGSLVVVTMHIPSRLEAKATPFAYTSDQIASQIVNASALYTLLAPFNAHLMSGHMHYNLNLQHRENLFEHVTAAACGTWWQGPVCLDGTPKGYGVYLVEDNRMEWYYKSAGFDRNYQLRVYPAGSSRKYPSEIIANVWNWDSMWRVEWLEDGVIKGEMERVTITDPGAEIAYADKSKLQFPWISVPTNTHMFKARPERPEAQITVRATDRFGNRYESSLHALSENAED